MARDVFLQRMKVVIESRSFQYHNKVTYASDVEQINTGVSAEL